MNLLLETEQCEPQGKPVIGLYKCYACRKPFTVKIGTIFEDSHAAMHLWMQAMYLLCSSKKGLSTNQLRRTLGVHMKTAWHMSHRIRLAMGDPTTGPLGGEGMIVESDETYTVYKEGGPTCSAASRTRLAEAPVQTLTALVRHRLTRGAIETLEAETLTLGLLRRALGERTSRAAAGSIGCQKLVDRAKLVLSSDLERRWTLAAIAADVGVSPVYLTQVFQQVEGLPLYRYQLQLRLARALDLLGDHVDLTSLALDLGFSSQQRISASCSRRAYGQTPSAFQRSARVR